MIVKFNNIVLEGAVDVYVKFEVFNFGFFVKDCIVFSMIEKVE